MVDRKASKERAPKAAEGFSEEEKAAVREWARERRAKASGKPVDGEQEVLAKIAEMVPPERAIAEKVHALVKATAPNLTSRTWYGMPAYAKDGQVVCFFQPASKFKTRYSTLGFSDEANIDEGKMWPVAYALTELTPADEARIVALVKRAVG